MRITLSHKTLLDALEAAFIQATVNGFDGWKPDGKRRKSSGEYRIVTPIDATGVKGNRHVKR